MHSKATTGHTVTIKCPGYLYWDEGEMGNGAVQNRIPCPEIRRAKGALTNQVCTQCNNTGRTRLTIDVIHYPEIEDLQREDCG